MKINPLGTGNTQPRSERDNSGKVEKTAGHFAADLLHSQDQQSRDQMNKLLDQINEQAAKLSLTPTYSELRSYRDLVRKFIGEATGRMYSLSTEYGWDRQGRQKVFTTIKKIDQTLSDMTEDIRLGQAREINIMAKHDIIRGMLVDLYM